MLRRLALTAVASAAASLAALTTASPAAYAETLPVLPPLTSVVPPPGHHADRLTVTISDAGDGMDGTYELECHPAGGSHPDARAACAKLDRKTRSGNDPFAPVPPGAMCTMEYGGPATARVTGTWAGRPVDAAYGRGDGCQIARWDALVPVLPKVGV